MNVELREGPENPKPQDYGREPVNVCIGHLSRTDDQIENMLLIRERLVVALPKGHRAARKKFVSLKDLEGELLIMPSKDLLPSVHQMIAAAFLKNHMPLGRYQMAEHFQTAVNLVKARARYVFLPPSAKDLIPDGVVLRTPSFPIGPFDTFALWSRGNVDPLVNNAFINGASCLLLQGDDRGGPEGTMGEVADSTQEAVIK